VQRNRASLLEQDLQAWQQSLLWLEGMPLSLPLGPGRIAISSGFGERLDPLSQRPAMHTGMDFEVPVGTPILAAGSGVVAVAGWDPQYGHNVVLRHPDGYTSRYAHANELRVKPGESVARGQLIALSGNSGRSTGPHLHFEILRHGKPLDPSQYLTALAVRR
jgi:murein DD-endopeptidase MepM/ murein hydrolase activator NlpD